MDTQHWQQIEEIFQSALDLAPAMREGFIAEQCGENSDLKREVEKLLADYDSAESFIESPVWTKNSLLGSSAINDFGNSLDEQLKDQPADPMLGRQIGAYRLTGEIGRGGMGAVYAAERADGSFRQRVAIKLIKRGMDTDFILRRFRQERQILAQLNHPFIAQLLDGGTTSDNLPYFVMEFIEGEPLYRYCDRKKLTINDRLRLFRQVCQAIDFAHQNQIIHRDIKPPNILVSARGTPKLLDFGIAKVLNPEFGIDTIDPTLTAMRLMTPEYASPEQVCGLLVTPASDIYALGVLLYELLTGHRPYRFKNRAAHEIARVICEEEPDRPSTGITRRDNLLPTGASEATTLIDLCRFRGAEKIEDLQRELVGDIERIILKCLRKEQSERYQTAAELEQDITRYLEGKPVNAETFPAAASAPVKSPMRADALTKSLAVLPLKILSRAPNADTGEEFLSVGLADALVTRLSGVRRIVVRPTSSVLRFGNGGDAFAAGRELGVDFVVDGNIRRVGKRIRVTVQLLNVKTNSTLWSESFDEQVADFLALEDSISERVAESLIPRLTGAERERLEKRGTNNPQAYEAYLRGRYFYNKFTGEDLPRAVESFREAIRLDSNYALPHVGIADFFAWSAIFGEIPSSEAFPQAAAAARRALEIDRELGEAYAILAFSTFLHDWDREEGFRLVRKAIELSPNYGFAHECYSNFLVSSGQFDEAIAEIKRAEELDPLSPRPMLMTAWTLYQTRRFDEALVKARRANDMEKDFPQGLLHLGNVLIATGEAEEAVRVLEKSYRLWNGSGLPGYMLCYALVAAGRRDDARKILNELHESAATRHVKTYFLGMAHAALDERDEAFEWFEKAVAKHSEWMIWFGTDAKLERLRDDPRYHDLLRRTQSPLAQPKSFEIEKPVTGGEKSIAVLPLKFIGAPSGTGEDEYLAVGLADAMITRLSNMRRFVVRPTSSVLRFRASDDSFEAGRELEVDFVLSGTVRRSGERIRISAQLSDVAANTTRWAQNFDQKLSDILEFEDTVSEQVVKSLLPQLTGDEKKQLQKRGTNNSQAYEAYLRGRFQWNLQSEESLAKAVTFFERAVELDPNYALAYAAIAEYYIFLGIHCIVPFTENAKNARDLVEKAVNLDPSLATARALLGFIELCYNRDAEAAETHLRQALKLNPNSVTAHNWLSTVLLQTGRFNEAVRETDRVISLDPDSIVSLHIKAWTLYHSRRFTESLEFHEKLIKSEPNYAWGLQTYSWVLRRLGRYEEAVAPAEHSVQLTGENPFYLTHLAAAYAEAGRGDEAEKILTQLAKISKTRFVSEYMLALVFCALGDKDRAFENLEKSFAARDGWLNWLGIDPQFDVLRDDARYEDLLRLAGSLLTKQKSKEIVAPSTGGAKSIAVLPLKLFGAPTGSDDEYLGIGLADALITRLSNVRRFIVRPTSSVLQFGAENADSFAAGRKLGVDYVVDGNIQRVDERIRVTIQLLSINENSSRWAKKFDEHFTDVLELEDSISERVAKSLLPQLTGEEEKQLSKRGTNNSEAYEAYLRGRFNWNLHTEAGFARAIGFYNRAIELDPNYALAYTAIAEYYIFLGIHCVIPFAEGSKAASDAAETAIRLDPTLAEAHAVRGFVAISYDFDWETAEKYLLRAIALNPNSLAAHGWYNTILLHSGRFDEAMREIDRVLELDPDSLLGSHFRAWAFYHSRRFDESIAAHRRILKTEPNYAWGLQTYSWVLRRVGRFDEAVAQARRAVELTGENPFYLMALSSAYAEAGNRAEAEEILARLDEISKTRFVSEYMLALVYCALNDKERAFENLEKAFASKDGWIVWIGVEPQFDLLRGDERFNKLMRRTNHVLAPQTAIEALEPHAARRKKSKEKSIAVLPLKLFGAAGNENTGDDNFLSVGLADALITRLSNVSRFVVRPTSSVLPYGKKAVDPFAAGRELSVDFVVDGSIRRVGDRIRITVQLLSVGENATHWAQTFDEKFSDVLTLEDSISEQVTKSLLPHLTGEEERQIKKRGTDNAEAFEAYLRGRHYWNSFTEEGFAKALIFYNKAISIAPDYALAYAGIADYYNFLGVYAVLPFAETSAAAKEAALKAIEIDADLAEGYAALGFATLMNEFDWSKAGEYIRRAIELNPNYALARIWYGYYLGFCGRFDEALTQINRAMEIDRYTPMVPQTLNWVLYHARRYDEAIQATGRFVKDEPRYGLTFLFFSSMLWRVGHFDDAIKICRRAVELLGRTPYTLVWLASAYAASGQTEKAKELIEEIEELSLRRYVSPYLLAMVYVNLNDAGKTFELLEKAWEIRDARLVWLGVDPQFDRLRGELQFEKLLRLTNNPHIIN
jgi:TolB-like protein/Flp pilus assembly protein TadD/tRNA A-37 threonylcarbamoyl transferase component Bud32